jgi:sporulation protein YlmC with PRC-barrel domain
MTEVTLAIGGEARTADGKITGYVKSVVVDRGSLTVTHLVVEPKNRKGPARLVRLDDHVDAREATIRLGYLGLTRQQVSELAPSS